MNQPKLGKQLCDPFSSETFSPEKRWKTVDHFVLKLRRALTLNVAAKGGITNDLVEELRMMSSGTATDFDVSPPIHLRTTPVLRGINGVMLKWDTVQDVSPLQRLTTSIN